MRPLKIIHIPYNNTPYQKLLLDNLKMFGLSIEYGRIVRFPNFGDISVLSNFIRDSRVDILHLHWQHPFLLGSSKIRTILRSLSFICQLLFIKACGKKLVWTVHNLKNHENKHINLELFFAKQIARFADAIIVHCESAKWQVQRVFRVSKQEKIFVIPHGSYLDVYENGVSPNEVKKQLNLPSSDLTYLFLGHIRPYKGLQELIDAFRKLNNKKTKLLIAGTAENRRFNNLLKKQTEDQSNIRLIPRRIADDEIQIYMNAADIMVLPYREILTSGAAILGMSFGKTIIAPNLGCLPDILDSSGAFLYDPSERDGLLNAMRRAMASRARIGEMGSYNLGLAKKLDWRNIAYSTYEVYKRC